MKIGHKPYYIKAGFIWLATYFLKKEKKFIFGDQTFEYLKNWYNVTWLNERQVEVPIALKKVREYSPDSVLEVGNVLSHYEPGLRHSVVDKYETSSRSNYFQQDISGFESDKRYRLIISISTLEHVGRDESPRDDYKVISVLNHLRGLLDKEGEIFFTAPVGYNSTLDRWVSEEQHHLDVQCMLRLNFRNEWRKATWNEISRIKFHSPYPFANGLMFVRVFPK